MILFEFSVRQPVRHAFARDEDDIAFLELANRFQVVELHLGYGASLSSEVRSSYRPFSAFASASAIGAKAPAQGAFAGILVSATGGLAKRKATAAPAVVF